MTPFDVTPWRQPINYAAHVALAHGVALILWPSGRRTLEEYGASVVITDLEACNALDPDVLRSQKISNLEHSMNEWRRQTHQRGYWIRQRHGRRKARRIVDVEWVKPSEYWGPMPERGGLLPV